jgi:hypothetical protein
MSKKRIIDSRTRSQSFVSLSYRQRDLWHGLIAIADDQGRLFGLHANVRSEVWPLDDIPLAEVEADLERLSDLEMIVRYEAEGKPIIQIINWWKYQKKQWAGPSDYPPPANWIDRTRYHGAEHKIIQENWDLLGGFCVKEGENEQQDSSDTPELPGKELPDLPPKNQVDNDVGQSINDSDSDNDSEEEKLNGASADEKPPEPPPKSKKGKKRDPLLDHPAIIAYREEARLHVPITWRKEVCEIVDDAEKWQKLVHSWIGKGWNKQNVEGMLQAYVNGGIGKNNSEPAGFEGIREYLKEEKEKAENGD